MDGAPDGGAVRGRGGGRRRRHLPASERGDRSGADLRAPVPRADRARRACRCATATGSWPASGSPGPTPASARRSPTSVLGVRICVVGCGAIGGLYAAHLAAAARARGVGLRRRRDARRRDQPATACASSAHVELTAQRAAPAPTPREIPPCRARDRRHQGHAHRGGDRGHARRSSPDGAVCSVQNGIGNEEVIAEHVPRVMRGVTLPAARVAAPGRDPHGRLRHDVDRAVRAAAGARPRRSSGSARC